MLRLLTVASVFTMSLVAGSLNAAPGGETALSQDSSFFYIAGHVRSPGKYPLRDGMTVQEAIAVAGGLTDRGSARRIKVRRMVDGKVVDVAVSLNDIVLDKDTLTIPQRLI